MGTCPYIDSIFECNGNGFLFDSEASSVDPNDTSHPCPACNTMEFLDDAKEEAETCSSYSGIGGNGSGVTIWEEAVALAMAANKVACMVYLHSTGVVNALKDDTKDHSRYLVQKFYYGLHPERVVSEVISALPEGFTVLDGSLKLVTNRATPYGCTVDILIKSKYTGMTHTVPVCLQDVGDACSALILDDGPALDKLSLLWLIYKDTAMRLTHD